MAYSVCVEKERGDFNSCFAKLSLSDLKIRDCKQPIGMTSAGFLAATRYIHSVPYGLFFEECTL